VDDGSFSIAELGTDDTAVVGPGFTVVDILEQTIFGKIRMKDVAAYTKSTTAHDETAWKRR
jgi:hypothetical protein